MKILLFDIMRNSMIIEELLKIWWNKDRMKTFKFVKKDIKYQEDIKCNNNYDTEI